MNIKNILDIIYFGSFHSFQHQLHQLQAYCFISIHIVLMKLGECLIKNKTNIHTCITLTQLLVAVCRLGSWNKILVDKTSEIYFNVNIAAIHDLIIITDKKDIFRASKGRSDSIIQYIPNRL